MTQPSYPPDSREVYYASSSAAAERNLYRENFRILRSYSIAAAFTAVFAVVYNHFGHGVQSAFMNFAWIWPALGTAFAVFFILRKRTLAEPGRVFLACGIATLTVGFLLQGVFAIAGTGSAFMPVFFFAGAGLLLLSVISLLLF